MIRAVNPDGDILTGGDAILALAAGEATRIIEPEVATERPRLERAVIDLSTPD